MGRGAGGVLVAGLAWLVAAPALADAPGPPRIDGLRVAPYTICDRKTRKCPRTAAAVRFTLSEDAYVAGWIDPVGAPAGRSGTDVDLTGRQGGNSFSVSERTFAPGRYRVTLGAEDGEGNESDTATAYFRVRHVPVVRHRTKHRRRR
jgi:hypothetical protein